MGSFVIQLPQHRTAVVSSGKIILKRSLLSLLWPEKFPREEKMGYLIRCSTQEGLPVEYRLFKSGNEDWFLDPEGKVSVQEDEWAMNIKKALEAHENKK